MDASNIKEPAYTIPRTCRATFCKVVGERLRLSSGMTKKNSSPDWFARGGVGLSILLSGIGLYFNYTSNSWQKATYEQSQEDRVSVRVGIYRSAKYKGNDKLVPNPTGRVTAEIVNIGMRPLYIKSVVIVPE